MYNRVFRRRSSTERRWAFVWHWELLKKKQVGSLYKRIVYSVGIPNNSHLLVLIRHFTKTGVLWLWSYWQHQLVRTSENYTNGRSTSTGMGVQQVWARAYRMNGNGRSYGRSAETLLCVSYLGNFSTCGGKEHVEHTTMVSIDLTSTFLRTFIGVSKCDWHRDDHLVKPCLHNNNG